MMESLRLPDFIGIGAMKAGSSALHAYLNMHPQITMSTHKELGFFVEELNWTKGSAWYSSCWPPQDNSLLGEVSPQYTKYPVFKGVPGRIHALIPDVKLVYILRDPIDRLISHYVHVWRQRREFRTIEEALTDGHDLRMNSYVSRSRYYFQLQQYLEYFDISHIYVMTAEDLKHNPKQEFQAIFRYLGVDEDFYSTQYEQPVNVTLSQCRKSFIGHWGDQLRRQTILRKIPLPRLFSRLYRQHTRKTVESKPQLSEWLIKELTDIYREDVIELKKLTSLSFERWSI